MENCADPIALRDHDYCRRKRVSERRAERAGCPCCGDDQVHHHSAPTANPPSSAEHPEVVNCLPSPQSSTSAADVPGLLDLVPTSFATIPPDELPLISKVSPIPQSSSAPLLHDNDPVRIHNHSVEDYQKIYHEVVDNMLHYKSGRVRPYSLELGRCIKQKLWERLNRPSFTSSVGEDGLEPAPPPLPDDSDKVLQPEPPPPESPSILQPPPVIPRAFGTS
ncbi:uncharacterized protein LOC119477808 isoform X2 [Sebastes umbrosus]|uniref:uncharacterized protein LOC119477808 isoform X2 n=1 Tax=Sebastes umbrosus TaxID=72105 RepID=UPI0018A07C3C|nr:uncharacterized protein LOC119477808 isoform X2 [Sebastes umbrosus]